MLASKTLFSTVSLLSSEIHLVPAKRVMGAHKIRPKVYFIVIYTVLQDYVSHLFFIIFYNYYIHTHQAGPK